MSQLYIGLMCGTSLDGFDAALVRISNDNSAISLIASTFLALDPSVKKTLKHLSQEQSLDVNLLATTDRLVAKYAALAVAELLNAVDVTARDIVAIGFHGITIRHYPDGDLGYSWQIGSGSQLTAATGIDVISDFRQMDVVTGGQGAPLVPLFHDKVFNLEEQVIVNLGGIANVSYKNSDGDIVGFDTGPANTLMDEWIRHHLSKDYDNNGQWAASGKVNDNLLEVMLADDYFALPAPKSTGKEKFNLSWLVEKIRQTDQQSVASKIAAEDVQATLVELTATSIANELKSLSHDGIILCGGGAHNVLLFTRLTQLLASKKVCSSEELKIDPDNMEAMAFAYFAYCRCHDISITHPSVTGGESGVISGAWYRAKRGELN